MMLTPQEITDKVFVKAVFGGYDMTGVDDFLESLSTDYAALYKENQILKGKLKVLVEKVEEYRSTEDAMRMALLTAQRMGEEITIEANKQKEEALRDADIEIRAKLEETAKRVEDEEWRLTVAAKETAKFIQLSQAIMQKHSEFLTKLETARRAVRPDLTPAPPQPPVQDSQIDDVAEQIGNAVEKITSLDASPQYSAPPYATSHAPSHASFTSPLPTPPQEPAATAQPLYDEDSDSARLFEAEDEEDSVSPRPKFDFDDLKFGANFESKL